MIEITTASGQVSRSGYCKWEDGDYRGTITTSAPDGIQVCVTGLHKLSDEEKKKLHDTIPRELIMEGLPIHVIVDPEQIVDDEGFYKPLEKIMKERKDYERPKDPRKPKRKNGFGKFMGHSDPMRKRNLR